MNNDKDVSTASNTKSSHLIWDLGKEGENETV